MGVSAVGDADVVSASSRPSHRWGLALSLATPLLWLAFLEAAIQVGLLERRFFFAPSTTLLGMLDGLLDGSLGIHAARSLERLIGGYSIGAALAVTVAWAASRAWPLRAASSPLVATTGLASSTAAIPAVMLVFGLGEASKWAMTGLTAFWTMLLVLGLVHDLASRISGQATWPRMPRGVAIFMGLKVSLATCLITLTFMEMVGSKTGLGYLLWRSWSSFEPGPMWVAVMTVSVIAYSGYLLLATLEWLAARWGHQHGAANHFTAPAGPPETAG